MKNILVVDDDQDIVELVRTRLEANNYQVTSASTGREGLRKVQQIKPDLIIMDIMMPEMEGGDAVRMLKADLATRFIPIIFLTALTTQHPVDRESRGINVDDQFYPAIAKPFEPQKLLAEVRKLIGGGEG